MWHWLQCIFYRWSRWSCRPVALYHRRTNPIGNELADQTASTGCQRRKPDWVIEKLISLAATHPGWGCRKIAVLFNQRHHGLHINVSKSYVAGVMKTHRIAIQHQRTQWRLRVPFPYALHAVWGLDLTKLLWAGKKSLCLGVIDHGSRQVVGLTTLPNKRSITLLRVLLDLVERYGIPQALRTDNEAVFTSGCPWQNGRIERLFGTLKHTLSQWALPQTLPLPWVVRHFQTYYNTYRPHQALNGKTPYQAAQQLASAPIIKKQTRRR
jgi:putative transposase